MATKKKVAAKKAVKKNVSILTQDQHDKFWIEFHEPSNAYFVKGLGIFIKFPNYARLIPDVDILNAIYRAGETAGREQGKELFKGELKEFLGIRECDCDGEHCCNY